jgi:hypothetical protein
MRAMLTRSINISKENKMRNRAIARAAIIATSCIAIAPYRTLQMHLVQAVAVIFLYSRTAQTTHKLSRSNAYRKIECAH